MNRFLLAAGLLLGSWTSAQAQRLVTQTATLAAGQGVFLDLKFAHTIRVRPGASLSVQAKVSINDNQQNDLYNLALEKDGAELSVVEKLDEDKLRESHYTGDCEGGSRNNSGGGVHGGYTRSSKTGGMRPTVSYHKGEYSYCMKIDYEVTVPAGAALRINTLSGDIDLSGLSGTIAAKTVSGDLLLSALAGAVTVRSVSGDVKLNNLSGNAIEAKSVSGNVDLTWPPAQAARLSLHTVTGEVYADPAVSFSNLKQRTYVGYELHGSYGNGTGPLVKLESVSGDVFFRKDK
ncbi:hypothetical protein E4631_10840 [Hymenobacter sp. UV11]|uniref:DUF4097 family beta strand repeat-containing protein n=1 Tax=Hymenobacter sp. UV11 TaxID=1849735 RepID=UPI00105F0960|nr:DUF4097 family beta strand repeat-containing protein [Hymenobacter sp. UV11]TDN40483.1 hypothetical protein A8B98_13715 [Hymenobacter sp. UV11]TFZ66505.1 hypothetical protein E4631_10840 [Hymenobacter sp. UV11]